MKGTHILLLLVIMAGLLLMATTAHAQDEGASSATRKNIIQKGGLIGGVIIIMSIVGVAFIIEHFVSLQRDKLAPPDIINELEMLLQDEEYDEALRLCDAERNPLTNIIGAGLPKLASGYESMAQAIREANDEEALKLFQKISYVNLIAQTSPLMGLLGTVVGMIGAFDVIATTENPKPTELAAGINAALTTTMFGLIVAIPMIGFYSFFKNKVTKMVIDIGNVAQELVERFRPIQDS